MIEYYSELTENVNKAASPEDILIAIEEHSEYITTLEGHPLYITKLQALHAELVELLA